MISVRRILGIETEYALVDRDDPAADPEALARDLLYAYAQDAAAAGAPATLHVPSHEGRTLLEGAGCRFDYSGELPTRDSRDGRDHDLLAEARTDQEAGAVLTGTPARWIARVDAFGQHYYRGSATHAANGARLYVDHTHPEYASPEVLGPRAAALYDRAGDLLMHEAQCALRRRTGHRIEVLKNNTDGHGSAWGAHESYAVERDVDWDLLTALLLPFLVSRQVVCGAGRLGIGVCGEQPGFQVLARADYVEQEVSLYTTRERPIVNTRDEPHADAGRWRRLHVITADSSCLPVATFLRTGCMAALLSLVETRPERAAALAERLALADPVAALRTFSHDTTLTVRCPLRRGGEVSALQMQRAFLEEVLAVGPAADEETTEVLHLWGQTLDALEAGPAQAARTVEWCARLVLLERMRSRLSCDWADPRLRALEMQLVSVDPAVSLSRRLEAAGTVHVLVDDAEAARAVTHAPADTRAGGRGALLAAFPQRVWAASWTSVLLDTDAERLLRVSLPDPHHPTAQEVARVLPDRGEDHGADAAELLTALRALGLDVPEMPRVFGWDEGVYADRPVPGPGGSGAPEAPPGADATTPTAPVRKETPDE